MTWLEAAGAVFLLLSVAGFELWVWRKGPWHREDRD